MRSRRVVDPWTIMVVGGTLAGLMSACSEPAGVTANSPAPSGTTSEVTSPSSTAPATSSSQPRTFEPGAPPPGSVVVLDPGHNGGNAANPQEINKPVPAGRGRTKPCNTTGTATDAGYTEHEFTWDVSVRVRDLLVARGVRVALTRPDDTGVGPCVNERAAIGNRENASAVVSIHADGSTAAGARGFHIAYSSPALNAQQETAQRLARYMRDWMRAGEFDTSNYIGSDGLSARDDLAGLNLSQRPAVLIECGNMRDASEAATLSSAPGRQRYAAAIAKGILGYLAD